MKVNRRLAHVDSVTATSKVQGRIQAGLVL